ncbi:hypothetical protein [Nocardia sp. NPDC058114]|uniref:hypothetical protein n=1 Tax=Nocardia sp. NPDC058114 TaxID=3346346 RepID=UPI0036D92F8F
MADMTWLTQETLAHECAIRNEYAKRLADFRPDEKLLKTEWAFANARARADMRTIDRSDMLRIWEFKIVADYSGLGQALTYLALTRLEKDFKVPVKGVLAAFVIPDEIRTANEVLNLGLEFVEIPSQLRRAGDIPISAGRAPTLPDIPTALISPTTTAN